MTCYAVQDGWKGVFSPFVGEERVVNTKVYLFEMEAGNGVHYPKIKKVSR